MLANAHLHAYGGAGTPAVPQTLPAQEQGRGLYLVGQLMEDVEIIPSKSRRRGVAIRIVNRLR